MRRTITSLFACACLLCTSTFSSAVDVAGLNEVKSIEVVAEDTYPAPTDLVLESYAYTSFTKWSGTLSWTAPVTELPVEYRLTYQKEGEKETPFSSFTISQTYEDIPGYTLSLGKYTFRVYAVYTVNEEKVESAPAVCVADYFADETQSKKSYKFFTLLSLRDKGIDPDGNLYTAVSEITVSGVIGDIAYVQDENGSMKLKLKEGSNIAAGDVITNMKGKLVENNPAESKCYVFEYESSDKVKTGGSVFADQVGSLYSPSEKNNYYQYWGKLHYIDDVTISVKEGKATIADSRQNSMQMEDPSGTIFKSDFDQSLTYKKATGYFDLAADGSPVFVLRSAEDLVAPKATSYANLQKFIDGGLELPIKSNVLVTGVIANIPNMMGKQTIYFLQDESAALSVSIVNFEELMSVDATTDLATLQAGDMLNDLTLEKYMEGVYGFKEATVVSKNNEVSSTPATLENIADYMSHLVRIEGATYTAQGMTLTQGDASVMLPAMWFSREIQTKLGTLNGKKISGVFYVTQLEGMTCLLPRSAEELEEFAYPTVSNFFVNSYVKKGLAWSIELMWDAPVVPEGAKIKDYTLKYVTIKADGTESTEGNFAYSETVSSSNTSCTSTYCDKDKEYKFRIYVNYTVGTETITSKMTETGIIDLTDPTSVLLPSYFATIAGVKNGANSNSAIVGKEVSIRGQVLVMGATPSVIYLGDAANGNPIKLLAAEGAQLPNLEAGTLLKDLKFVLKAGAMDRSYTAEYVSSSTISTGNTVTPYDYFYVSNVSGSDIGRLAALKSVALKVDKEAKTATVSQETQDGTSTIELIDPSEKIYAADFVVPTSADIVFFVELNGEKPVLQLRSIEDIKPGSPTSFETIAAMKEAGEPESSLIYTLTGDVIVTGKYMDPYMYSTTYFGQDETGALMFRYGSGGGGEPLALNDAPAAKPEVGDIIANMRGEYTVDYGYDCYSFDAKSTGNDLPVAVAKTIPLITSADLGMYVKVCGILTIDVNQYSATLTNDENSINVDVPISITPDFDMEIDAAVLAFNGKSVSGNFNVNFNRGSLSLALTSAANLEEYDPSNISNVEASQITVDNGMITVEGASVEVYNAAGCRVAASTDGKVSVAGMNGMMIIKAVYANGEVKVIKTMVK